MAVSIGVPILLAYIYGVVPFSLCRAGGCGLSTTPQGVRFEFDDENDALDLAAGARQTGTPRRVVPWGQGNGGEESLVR